jgi:energy-coupling factor transporter ATP-binding protein EcfA2
LAERSEPIAWPPKLVGALFDGSSRFGGRAFLPIDNLTVLLGANGAGKTTTLRALQRELPSLASAPEVAVEDDDLAMECTFFVEVSDQQLEALVRDAVQRSQDAEIVWPFRTPGWPPVAKYGAIETDADDVIAEWLTAVQAAAPTDLAFDDQLRGLLMTSRIIAVRARSRTICDLAWCLSRADAEVAGLAKAPDGLQDPAIPMPLVPLGTSERTMLPTAVGVPRDLNEIRVELREAMIDILVHLRWGERDHWARTRGIEAADTSTRRGTRAWLEHPDAESSTVAPSARALCGLASRLSTALAPPFVSDSHSIDISIEPFPDWDRGGPGLALELSRGSDVRFPVRRAADGYKVWLQLALLESVAILRRYSELLHSLLGEAIASRSSPADAKTTRQWKTYLAAVALLERFTDSTAHAPVEQFIALRNVGHRLYLIDEPEQHLHPRLQRSATRWLSEAGTASGSQCIVVTHSPHYLRIPGDVAFAYLQRIEIKGTPRISIRRLTPQLLSAADDVAADMGFDRGELMNSVSAVVFVEGQADKQFLEALSGAELHHAGVLLVPIHGAVSAQRKGLVDSEIVLSITAAKLAVLLDNLVEAEWRGLQTDPDLCRETARSSKKTELKAMAEILSRAQEVGRIIEPLGIPVPDIFDLLDEDLLRKRFPSFPGHSSAREGWLRANQKQKVNWKSFYLDRYGIAVEPNLFGSVAAEMAADHRCPAQVTELVGRLKELAETP